MAKKSPPKVISSEIAIEQWPIDKPVECPTNARLISEVAVSKVAASIYNFGWRQAIVVDEAGVIISGHTRLRAAKQLGLKHVPVHVAKGLSDEKVRAYRLADNRTSQETTWDNEKLAEELASLSALFGDSTEDADYLSMMTGFDVEEIAEIAFPDDDEPPADDTPPPEGNVKPKREILVSCTCPKCGHEWTDGAKPKVPRP